MRSRVISANIGVAAFVRVPLAVVQIYIVWQHDSYQPNSNRMIMNIYGVV
jgi:hypothetical protein